jgi:hypothetical protein
VLLYLSPRPWATITVEVCLRRAGTTRAALVDMFCVCDDYQWRVCNLVSEAAPAGLRERHMPNRNASLFGNDVLRNQRREHDSEVAWMTKEVDATTSNMEQEEIINSGAC